MFVKFKRKFGKKPKKELPEEGYRKVSREEQKRIDMLMECVKKEDKRLEYEEERQEGKRKRSFYDKIQISD